MSLLDNLKGHLSDAENIRKGDLSSMLGKNKKKVAKRMIPRKTIDDIRKANPDMGKRVDSWKDLHNKIDKK